MTNMREQRTLTGGATSVVCQCGTIYKNHRGLQVHQTKSGCQICMCNQRTYLSGETEITSVLLASIIFAV